MSRVMGTNNAMLCRFETTDGGTVHINAMLVRAVYETKSGICGIVFDREHMISVVAGGHDVIRQLNEALRPASADQLAKKLEPATEPDPPGSHTSDESDQLPGDERG